VLHQDAAQDTESEVVGATMRMQLAREGAKELEEEEQEQEDVLYSLRVWIPVGL
jgi:hypothetical protein